MSRKLVLWGVFLFTLSSAATLSAGSVDIWAYKTVAGQEYSQRAAYFSLKLCRTGTQTCTYGGTTDTNGRGNVYISPSFAGWYDLYLYKDYGANYGGEWGSQTQPIGGGAFQIPQGFTSITVSVITACPQEAEAKASAFHKQASKPSSGAGTRSRSSASTSAAA